MNYFHFQKSNLRNLSRGFKGTVIKYNEDTSEWVMSKESQSQPIIGRASASLENVGTGLLEWRLNDNVCNTRSEGLARSLMTVCKVFYLQHAGVVC